VRGSVVHNQRRTDLVVSGHHSTRPRKYPVACQLLRRNAKQHRDGSWGFCGASVMSQIIPRPNSFARAALGASNAELANSIFRDYQMTTFTRERAA